MAPRAYHHGDLPRALLDAAEALVREKGVAGWSLREVSSRVGVSPSAAYHHFVSREALVRELARRALGELSGSVRRDIENAPQRGDARLVALGRGYVRWALGDPALFRVAFGPDREYPGVMINRDPYGILVEELDRYAAAGGLDPLARRGAEVPFWSALHGLATLVADGPLQRPDEVQVDRLAEDLVRTVLRGLSAGPPARQ